jgi:hypothetical protein
MKNLAAAHPRTSKITSISTSIRFGSDPMPTAERAWRPASPSTSTGAAVDHVWMVGEIRFGIDHPYKFQHGLDALQRAERRFGNGEQ